VILAKRPGTLLRWHALKRILQVEIKDGLTVLDVGAYDGFIAHKLTEIFPNLNITVVDLDISGLNIAKEHRLNTVLASGLVLPIRSNSLDLVLCFDLLEHVEEDSRVVKEISRVLQRDGRIILTTPMGNKSLIPFLNMTAINQQWGHVRNGYALKQIQRLFEKNDLCICKSSKYCNILSRYAYYLAAFSKTPLRHKWALFRSIIKFEPFIKLGAWEHIIVGKKGYSGDIS